MNKYDKIEQFKKEYIKLIKKYGMWINSNDGKLEYIEEIPDEVLIKIESSLKYINSKNEHI